MNKVIFKTRETKNLTPHAKFFFILLLMLFANEMQAQISSTPTGGLWDAPNTWVDGIKPSLTDDVVIPTGSIVIVGSPNSNGTPALCNSLTINGTVTLGSGGASTTTRRLDVGTFLLINSGGTLNNGTGAAHLLFIGGDFTNQGTFTPLNGTGSIQTTFNGAAAQTIIGAGQISFQGITVNKPAAQLLSFSGLTTLDATTITLTSGDLTTPPITNISGSLTLSTGNYTGGENTSIGGDLTANTGSTFSVGTGTVTFNGTTQIIKGSIASLIFHHLITSGITNTTLNRPITVNGNIIVADGTTLTLTNQILSVGGTTTIGGGTSGTILFSVNSGTKTFGGLVTINQNAIWDNAIARNVNFQGGITLLGGIFTAGSGTHTFETNPQSLTGDFTIPIVSVSSGATLTNNGILTVATSLAGSGGLAQAAGATLHLGSTITITTLNATVAGNSVNYTGTAQTIKNTNYTNIELSGSGVKTFQTGTSTISGNLILSGTASATTMRSMTIGGNVSIGDGTTLTLGGFDLTINGTTTIGGGTSGSLILSSTANSKTFKGLLTIAPGGTWDNAIGDNTYFESGIANNGNFIGGISDYTFQNNAAQTITGIISITTLTLSSTPVVVTLTNNGNLTVATSISGGGTLVQGNNAVLNVGNTIGGTTTLIANTNPNTVIYTGAAQTVKGINYSSLGLSGSGIKTLTTTTTSITGNLSLSGTATSGTGANLAIGGNLFIGDGTTFSMRGHEVTVGGETTIGGGTSGILEFVNSPTGAKIFSGLVTVSNNGTWSNVINAAPAFRGGISNDGIFIAETVNGTGTGIYTFDTNAQEISGTLSIPKVVVSGITLTNYNSLNVSTSLSGSGTLAAASNSSITIDGTSTLSFMNGDATSTVTYNTAAASVIGGMYGNLILNPASGDASLTNSATVKGTLTLQTGNLNLGASHLTIGESGAISIGTPSATSMIVSSGGEVRKTFTSNGSFAFPIGDNTVTPEYSPVTIDITSATGFTAAYVGVSVVDAKHPNNGISTEFLSRYWNVTQSGIAGGTASINGTYLASDISGVESDIASGQLSGTFNQVSNGWKKLSPIGSNLLTASEVLLTSGVPSSFTGISKSNPSVAITGGNVSVCANTAVQLGAAVIGDALTYLWTPATGLSSTSIANPMATAANTTTYTLTVYDGNGFSASDETTITTQKPTVTVNALSLCAGSTGVLTASGAVSYSWSPATGLSSTTTNPVNANPTTTTTYTVVGTDANSCTASATALVTVTPLPAKPTITPSNLNTETPTLTSSSVTGNQWFKDAGAISGATAPVYNPTTVGAYTVKVTNNSCESLVSDAFVIIVTGIENEMGGNGFRVYPNPANEILMIDWRGFSPDSEIQVKIVDMVGRTSANKTMVTSQTSVDVRNLARGQHIFHASQNSMLRIIRFIKN